MATDIDYEKLAKAVATAVVAAMKPLDVAVPIPPRVLGAEHKGTKTYRIKAPHYRDAEYYAPGDLITVTDEIPSKTWDLVTAESEAKLAKPVPHDLSKSKGRASDANI